PPLLPRCSPFPYTPLFRSRVADGRLKALEAQIAEAESNLDGSRTNLEYTKIYAPMSGSVVAETAREGQTLNANQTAPIILQLAKDRKSTRLNSSHVKISYA